MTGPISFQWRIVVNRFLPKPRLEPTTFSGGRNLSAMARNAKRIEEARRIVFDHSNGTVIVPEWFLPEFKRAMAEKGLAAE